jgi:hypothetical protein
VAKKNRDDFSPKTLLQIAKRAGWLCSFPTCRTPTVGATSDGEGEINIGTAAHICAAASGGPRYDEKMSPEERSSAKNGIWMCRDHGKAIDSTDPEFTVERLREWKIQAENDSMRRVLRNEAALGPAVITDAQFQTLIRSAAEADLKVFQRTAKWPSTSVALTLEVDGFNEPVTTSALANVVTSLDDLILVAPPGMGKTTTLFQIAEGVLANGNGTPLIVQLGDWATEGATVLNTIIERPAFRGISEDDFRKAAAQPGVVLLLDGWNELDVEARKRASVQVAKLKAELPELGLVVSTRRQALDVPFGGTRVDLLPLNEDQQMQIAVAMRGDAGAKLIDQAWRTAGVRELVTIPLYLTALLSLPEQAPFPATKEEVLRYFVSAHEKEASRAEALHAVTQGCHQDYLDGLAVFATLTANTAIADRNARRSIFDTETLLADHGQITTKPEPNEVLAVLVSNHVLMRAGDAPGYSFQHQQFQEWYASHLVEHRIIREVDDPKGRKALKAEVLNLPVWEEAILFAVERLARGDAHQRAACGNAIVAAFEVDPILAAEMIFRSTEEVWTQIAPTIQGLVARWHAPGKVDRAFRFMLTSGRSEFFDKVWPLITDENEQISLKALRNCRRFRPSILGKDAEKKIKALSQRARTVLLGEMASRSGMDGLDLASTIAKDDPDPEVQASVVDALSFRRADRHVALVLQQASDKTFDLIARKGIVDEVNDEQIKKGVSAARKRQAVEPSAYDRLRVILHAQDGEDRSAELTDIISTMEIERRQDSGVQLIYGACKRYPSAVSDGLLARVFAGRTLFYGADDMLASTGFRLEDDALLQLALAETPGRDDRAEAAASVLGPRAAGCMIDALLDVATRLRDANGKYDKAASGRYRDIQARIAHVPGASLVAAVQARSAQADNEQMARLAELLSRHPDGDTDRGRPFDAEDLATIRALAEDWGNRMLASGNAERRQVASIAVLASHAPDVSLLPLLKRMLDDNLRRYRAFREEAEAAGWRHGNAVNEASWPMTHEYQRAFLAIDVPETAVLMREYLADPHFGELAAGVLASQWMAANEPLPDKGFFGGIDFNRVGEKRAARAANPAATSAEAEAIFAVIEPLTVEGATDDQKKHAAALGIVAVRLPHGQRDATIEKLIAPTPRRGRPKLLLNLILAGAEIDSRLVADGLAETLEAAKKEPWILTQSEGYELREWLRLLPFTNRPADAIEVVRGIPDAQRQPRLFEELVGGLAETPSEGGEEVLFKLAEEDPRFYQNHQWRAAALKLGTASAAHRLIDLTANGTFDGKSLDDWYQSRELGVLIAEFPEVRRHVYGLLKDGVTSRPLALLAQAVSESPDTEGLLLLIDIENKQKRSVLRWHTIENVVTEHVPVENWGGAYNVVPVPAIELRQKLLAMMTDGGPTDAAARCLNTIDVMRDEHGVPVSEPRHPDLTSGKPWPIMTPDPYATAD